MDLMQDPLTDEGLDEVFSMVNKLSWTGRSSSAAPSTSTAVAIRHNHNHNDCPCQSGLFQCQQDMLNQRVQMATFLEKIVKLEEKVCISQTLFEDARSESKNFRLELESEKARRTGLDAKVTELDGTLQKTIRVVGSLINKLTAAGKSIKDLEEEQKKTKEVPPPPNNADEAIEVLNSLSNEIQIRFTETEENQARVVESIQKVKESVEDLAKQAESNSSKIELTLAKKVEGNHAKFITEMKEIQHTVDEFNKQLQSCIQQKLSEVSESQAKVTEEMGKLKETVEDLDQRIQSKPEVQIQNEGKREGIEVITVDDDEAEFEIDSEDNNDVDEVPTKVENKFTLSSLASKFSSVSSSSKGHRKPIPNVKNTAPSPSSSPAKRSVTHAIDDSRKGTFCICGKRFKTRDYLRSHVHYHTAERKFPCPTCPERFVMPIYLKRHQIAKHNDLQTGITFPCSKCRGRYRTKKELRIHYKSCNGKRTKDNASPPPSLQVSKSSNSIKLKPDTERASVHHGRDFARHLFCLCGSKYRKFADLNRHLQYYTSERKYICNPCGKAFLLPCRLKKHMKGASHKRTLLTTAKVLQKPQECPRCGNSFRTLLELENHMRSFHKLKARVNAPTHVVDADGQEHTFVEHPSKTELGLEDDPDPNRFYCKCGKSYTTKQQIALHLRIVVRGKVFRCTMCPASFDVHSKLKLHVTRVHHIKYNLGKFACPDCTETFDLYRDFRAHRFAIHDAQV